MSSLRLDFLRHILAEIEFLLNESEKTTEAEFLKNEALKRAFARSFEIIDNGEADI